MSKCYECGSPRVAEIATKCPEGCKIYIGDEIFHEGDVPTDMNIGEADDLNFSWCLSCGLIQADFPLEKTALEEEHDPTPEEE